MNAREPWWVGLATAAGLTMFLSVASGLYGEGNPAGYLLLYGMGAVPFLGGYYVRGWGIRLALVVTYAGLTLLGGAAIWPALDDPDLRWEEAVIGALLAFAWLAAGLSFIVGLAAGSIVPRVMRRIGARPGASDVAHRMAGGKPVGPA